LSRSEAHADARRWAQNLEDHGLKLSNPLAATFDHLAQMSSEAFRKFRGEEWLPEPCKNCARGERDFGDRRCQAFLLTADVTATDPVCSLAPQHPLVDAIVAAANRPASLGQTGFIASIPPEFRSHGYNISIELNEREPVEWLH
jgi:hypothetical protein